MTMASAIRVSRYFRAYPFWSEIFRSKLIPQVPMSSAMSCPTQQSCLASIHSRFRRSILSFRRYVSHHRRTE